MIVLGKIDIIVQFLFVLSYQVKASLPSHAASTVQPVELCTLSYRDPSVKFNVSWYVKYSMHEKQCRADVDGSFLLRKRYHRTTSRCPILPSKNEVDGHAASTL